MLKQIFFCITVLWLNDSNDSGECSCHVHLTIPRRRLTPQICRWRSAQPFWAYDAEIIQQRIAQLSAFDVVRFAQKACSNIHILRLMRCRRQVDSVSLGEIERALAAGFQPGGEDIVFTADVLDSPTLARIAELKVPVNAGSVDMLHQLGTVSPVTASGCALIRALATVTARKLIPAAKTVSTASGTAICRWRWRRFSSMACSWWGYICTLAPASITAICSRCATRWSIRSWPLADLQAISAGGGLSIPYRFGEEAIDTQHYYGLWNGARERIAAHLGHVVKLEIEPGRFRWQSRAYWCRRCGR